MYMYLLVQRTLLVCCLFVLLDYLLDAAPLKNGWYMYIIIATVTCCLGNISNVHVTPVPN